MTPLAALFAVLFVGYLLLVLFGLFIEVITR